MFFAKETVESWFKAYHNLLTKQNQQSNVLSNTLTLHLPGINPENIAVTRVGRLVTIVAEQYPFDIIGDKYFEKYEIAKGKVLDSVVFVDGDKLELLVTTNTTSQPVTHYTVRDLRQENRDDRSSNFRPT